MKTPLNKIVRRVIKESLFYTPSDKLKSKIFKLWDKQKSMGIKPKANLALAKSVGLEHYGLLEEWIVEWYGGFDTILEEIKNNYEGRVLTTNDLEDMGIYVGEYDFTFKIVKISEVDRDNSFEIKFQILDGEFFDDGHYYSLLYIDEIPDNIWNEVYTDIRDTIQDMGYKICGKNYSFSPDEIYVELL
jgi:hypothetical protein